MKKIFMVLIAILFAGAVSAQTSNSFKYVINAKGGVNVTLKATSADKVDSIKVSSGAYKLYQGATQLSPDIPTSGQISLATVVPMNTDTIPRFIFGNGNGDSGDSILFAKNRDNFGTMPNYRDTCIIINFKNLYLSSGDSLKWNAYIGNSNTRIARDSCFTAPQALGVNQRYLTPNNATIVRPDECVWIKLKADQVTGKRPYRWEISINCKQQNRTY